jgi:DNA-binding CsgD family transcriptional regulator
MMDERERVGAAAPVQAVGTVAWIDLGVPATGSTRALAHALRQIGRAVRADDRVCPVGGSSVAVQFGPVASVVPLEVLGDRIARAIGPCLPPGPADTTLTVAVGMSLPSLGEQAGDVAGRARSAARSAARALSARGVGWRATAAVTVDESVAPRGTVDGPCPVALHRRSVRRYGAGRIDGIPALVPEGSAPVPAYATGGPRTCALSVLIVDPMASAGQGGAGFASQTAVSVAERLGCRTSTPVVSPDEPLPMTVDGADVDLVVLVLDGAWVGRSPNWATGAWGLPARLTTAYVDKGVPVLAVGAGAGAGAVAACVAQGALALFSLDRLADALRSLDELPLDEARQVAELGFPNRFRSLLGLTAGERRILFYLTEGWAAQDIADELVVSLTTVRSHIRSVLRKLEVRSQLAAVAIANSRDLDQHRVTAHS